MRAAVLLALLLAAACDVGDPVNEEVDAPPGAADAAEILRLEWRERLGDFPHLVDLPEIRWFAGDANDCLTYPDDDTCLDGKYRKTFGHAEIHLLYYDRPSASALAHELLHRALDEGGDLDGDHGSSYWDEVPDLDAMLAAAGL